MAIDSKKPKINVNNGYNGSLNNAMKSSSSFDPRSKNNKGGISSPQKNIKKKLITEGIKKAAQVYGVPESATESILETDTGKEAIDVASSAPTITEGAKDAAKVITKKVLIKSIPFIALPFLFLLLIFILIFSKDTFGGIGDGTDQYEELRKEIGSVISKYSFKTDVDGVLILATLIGYNDMEDIENNVSNSKNMAYLKKQVSKLAEYQIMTTKTCPDDSSTMRKIASNDDFLNETNNNCVSEEVDESYSLSIEEGKINDDNSGSVYYWNLIDEGFIFEFYNDYMPNKSDANSSENTKKISEIISDIYLYYASLKEASDGNDYFISYKPVSSGYWWPIGSTEVTEVDGKLFAKGTPYPTVITATFAGNDSVHNGSHGALDIGGYMTKNSTNIIATAAGTVVYPTDNDRIDYSDGCWTGEKGCVRGYDGGGYGNYVVIDHGGGIYSLYGHLYANTITVRAGDTVEQGQVIAKMGTSGNSTGPHLHFEIRNGANSRNFRVDPLSYVDPDNPRPSGNAFIEWIKNVEGGVSGKYVDGNNYIVYDGGDGVLTVGYGIVIVASSGQQLYLNIYDTPVTIGSRIPMNIVDKMFNQYMSSSRNTLAAIKTNLGITLTAYQDDAILSLMYNCGSSWGGKALDAYGLKADTDALWNKMSQCKNATINGKFTELYGLKLRRAEEFELFMTGDYKYNPLSYRSGDPVKYYDVKSW